MVTSEEAAKKYNCKLFPKNNYKNFFYICFIDGNHKIDKYILNDYNISKHILKDDGIIMLMIMDQLGLPELWTKY